MELPFASTIQVSEPKDVASKSDGDAALIQRLRIERDNLAAQVEKYRNEFDHTGNSPHHHARRHASKSEGRATTMHHHKHHPASSKAHPARPNSQTAPHAKQDKAREVTQLSHETKDALRGLYTITKAGRLTVTAGLALDSKQIASLDEGSGLNLVEVAEESQAGQVRARIYQPAGYVSVWAAGDWFIKKDMRLRDTLVGTGIDYDSLSPRALQVKDEQRARQSRLSACEFSPVLHQLEMALLGAGSSLACGMPHA